MRLKFQRSTKKVPSNKITAKKFPAKIYFTVDILIVNINCGTESDSEDEEEYHLGDKNTINNPEDDTSIGNVIIVDPLGHPRSRICDSHDYRTLFYIHITLKSIACRLHVLNKKKMLSIHLNVTF